MRVRKTGGRLFEFGALISKNGITFPQLYLVLEIQPGLVCEWFKPLAHKEVMAYEKWPPDKPRHSKLAQGGGGWADRMVKGVGGMEGRQGQGERVKAGKRVVLVVAVLLVSYPPS